MISIHAPTNGATSHPWSCKRPALNFNPRSDERSDFLKYRLFMIAVNFNPRSDERSDDNQLPWPLGFDISIHAPTNGATQPPKASENNSKISIHAPTNGATYFDELGCRDFIISIHAPTNGATCVINTYHPDVHISIHAPTNGATQNLTQKLYDS